MNYVSACEAKKLLHINGTTLKVLNINTNLMEQYNTYMKFVDK